jgi:hypothetical protein
MLTVLAIALGAGSALLNVVAWFWCAVAWIRDRRRRVSPEVEERALMRSLSWPTENGDGLCPFGKPA